MVAATQSTQTKMKRLKSVLNEQSSQTMECLKHSSALVLQTNESLQYLQLCKCILGFHLGLFDIIGKFRVLHVKRLAKLRGKILQVVFCKICNKLEKLRLLAFDGACADDCQRDCKIMQIRASSFAQVTIRKFVLA